MFRPIWIIAALAFALSAVVPGIVTAQDEVSVVGQHTIIVQKSARNATTGVSETVSFSVEEDYSGTLRIDLDPQATVSSWFFTDRSGTIPGDAGRVRTDEPPSESVDGFKRYTIDLGANNLTFTPDDSFTLHLAYSLPGDDRTFERRVDRPTPQLNLLVQSTAGLEPQSEDLDLRALGNTWNYNLPPEDQGPWVPGETLRFTFTDVDVPKAPLSVSISSTGTDPIRLRANVDGGIGPYTITWDTDDDNVCDDADGETYDLARGETGRQSITACVEDARGADFTVRDSYEVTVVQGPTQTAGPTGWLLGLVGLVIGALLVYGLAAGGIVRRGGGNGRAAAPSSTGRSLSAESKDMLQARQRVMVAALKELEIAKKKGEVAENLYTPLKAELKQDTVRVMRELEKRKDETV